MALIHLESVKATEYDVLMNADSHERTDATAENTPIDKQINSEQPTKPTETTGPAQEIGKHEEPATRNFEGWRNTFVSLKHRNFLYLWIGMLFSMGGIQMQMIARGYLTYEISSSPLILGLVNAGFALPMLAFALVGGAIADRLERRRIMQCGQAAVGLIALFIGLSNG